jgi:hypothetical protein
VRSVDWLIRCILRFHLYWNLSGVDVARSACWTYVTWYHDLSTTDWATWLPGTPIRPGSVGVFNRERCFDHSGETLEDRGVACARLSVEIPVPPIFYSTMGGFEFEPKVTAIVAPGFAILGEAEAAVKLTANTEHACLVQMLNPTVRQIENQRQVQEAVLARVIDGLWDIDLQVVMRRTRCTSGFAAVSRAGGQSVEFKTSARLPAVVTDQNLPGLELGVASGHSSSGFLLTRFIETSTPAFGGVVRVKRELWHKLLPWRSEGWYLVDPRGKRFLPSKLPLELSAYAPRDRCYDPARSSMSPAELSALMVEDVFEEVTMLPDEDEPSSASQSGGSPGPELAAVRSFPLPRSAIPSTLAAGGSTAEGQSILLDAAFEDGLVQFTVYDRGPGSYLLEVTFRRVGAQPNVVTIRYQATDGASRDLIVPVSGDGATASSSTVSLPGYRPGTDGLAWLAAVSAGQAWPAETVRRSVLAAAASATARAWERIAALVPAETREVIERALRDLRGTA